MAAMEDEQGARTTLNVYDLSDWTVAWSLSDLPEGELSWESSGLYLWSEHCEFGGAAGTCKQDWERTVSRLTPEGSEELVRLDFASYAASPYVNEEGTHAYLVGITTDVCCGIDPQGDSFLAVLDLESGSVTDRIPLPGLLIGQPGHWLGSTEHVTAGRYMPGLAVSSDESTAYVVHAEADRIAEIDLVAKEVAVTHSLEAAPSAASRLGDWLLARFASTAEAKETADYIRDVQITPDSRYLLISGSTVEQRPDETPVGQWPQVEAAGLLVVDMLTMEVVYEDDITQDFTLSPNGYSVLGWGRVTGLGVVRTGLTVLDLRSMTHTRLYEHELISAVFASPDGRFAYAQFGRRSGRLVGLDLETLEPVAEYTLEDRDNFQYDVPRGLQVRP